MKKFIVFMGVASAVGLGIILFFAKEAKAGKALHEAEKDN